MQWPAADARATPRLLLEPLTTAHTAQLLPVLADPALYAFTGGAPPTAEELRARHTRQAAGASPDGSEGWLNWVLRLRDTGAVAGLRRFGAWVHPGHAASGAVARRCGLAPTEEVRDGEVRWAG